MRLNPRSRRRTHLTGRCVLPLERLDPASAAACARTTRSVRPCAPPPCMGRVRVAGTLALPHRSNRAGKGNHERPWGILHVISRGDSGSTFARSLFPPPDPLLAPLDFSPATQLAAPPISRFGRSVTRSRTFCSVNSDIHHSGRYVAKTSWVLQGAFSRPADLLSWLQRIQKYSLATPQVLPFESPPVPITSQTLSGSPSCWRRHT